MERKPLPFVRRGHSVRSKEKKNRDEEGGGALSRWLRELRGEPKPAPPPERSNPIYHSEGKGLRSRKQGRRRHSFQHHHRCCGDENGGGKRGSAMTGETATSNGPYILNTSPALKTVMEREKFLPTVDREGKSLGEPDYTIPSPPERDTPHLDTFTKYTETRLSQLSIDGGYDGSHSSLTRAELEQYSRAYEEVRAPSHSQQPSYAQSEGYHSYVSSSDSTTTTPFLDRLRRENETGRESSASSGSSSETLKWHGSLSDVSSTPQHIAHSARVPMPQRHHSESVLYLEPWPQPVNNNMRRLFPVSTYEPTAPRYILGNDRSPPKLSVAERICEIERRGSSEDKRRGMTDHASLKAIQKKALLSFYERHASAWKSEPQLTAPSIPPQPPPRPPPQASRRSSSASDYAGALKREVPRSSLDISKVESNGMRDSKHQHSSSCGSLTTAALGPMIIGPSICVDDWVPARPPKKPHLRAAYPPPPGPSSPTSPSVARSDPPYPLHRPVSPEPPPPSPPPPPEAETYPDEPLPPPPPEVQPGYASSRRFERAINASLSLDNLTRSDKPSLLQHTKSHDPNNDGYYENGTEIKRNEHNKNGFSYADKFNERFVENRIETMQSSYCDPINELWDKKNYLDMRKYNDKKQPEAQVRTNLLSPPLPNKKRSHNDQPRSLDSNLSIVECNNEVNKPGPQTPIHKKYSGQMSINGHEKQINYKNIRENFLRAVSVPNEPQLVKNAPERQSLRFTTATQKLLVNGKIANAIHNGKISPPSRKANLVRTPSDVVRRVAGIHHAEPLGKHDSLPKPTLPPHCPPTTLQLSQSKASYLSYRREPKEKEKGLPNFQGSYKRTMSPSGGRIIETAMEKPIEKIPPASPVSEEEKLLNDAPKEEKQPIKKEEEPSPPSPEAASDRDVASKTLPRGYPVAGPAKQRARAPRAQSDPTCSAKVEKKTVSASTQDNLDEIVREEKAAVVGRSQSERTETRRVEEPRVSDASSQTTPTPSPPPTPPRRHLQEEIECDQLSRDLASQLSPSHKLHGILVPGPDVKRSTDYVTGLFRMDFTPRSRSSLVTSQTTSSTTTTGTSTTNTTQTIQQTTTQQTATVKSNGKENESLTPNNTNFTTSECKAHLLSSTCNSNSQIDNGAPSSIGSLQQKKEELMMRLSRKLLVLKAESVAVTEETEVNEALGNAVSERVERVARPHEVSRFKLHVKEVGHITSLLLSLSGRLARAENALLVLPPEHPERKALEEKRDKLLAQLNEAKQLKSNIDQRSGMVSSMLYNYLTGEEYTDYDHFINMKSKLLVDSREIAEKIQLGEEQLAALKETLDQVR